MPNIHEPQLVNTIGHSAGAIIFGIFLFLLLCDRAGAGSRRSVLSIAAALLAFLWNIGSLAVLITPDAAGGQNDLIVAFSFAVLSLLPAVLLHLSLERTFRPVIALGYMLSVVAVVMHLSEVIWPRNYHREALFLITIGFALLTIISVFGVAFHGDRDNRKKSSRIFGAMCAALFAISFVHFGSRNPQHAWSGELALHHAGLPLALFVLLQDYRFLLLDAFVRFLANVLLAAVLTFVVIRAALHFLVVQDSLKQAPLYEALLLTGLCFLLIMFALLRTQVQRWLTRVVFRRGDLDRAIGALRARPALLNNEPEFLAWAVERVAEFMSAEQFSVVPEGRLAGLANLDALFPQPVADTPGIRNKPEFQWVEALIPLRLSQADVRYLLLGRRRGGRPYLSEDLQSLAHLGSAIAEQIERYRSSEMQRLVSQAEFRALQSQINPHFLFNALNTIYGIIPREAAGARRTVMNLAEIFRYSLQSDKAFIHLDEEMQIVQAYLDIERLRLGARLQTRIEVDDAALRVSIPILSVQPLVENAVKHGLAQVAGGGWLTLSAKMLDDQVCITVQDTGIGMSVTAENGEASGAGVGLANLRKRLQLCYGPAADLIIASSSSGTRVQFSVPIAKTAMAVRV